MHIITGASRGIGKYIFDDFKSREVETIGLARSGGKDILECDISDYQSIKKVAESIKEKYGKIYSLINVAGIASMNLALATPENTVRKIIDTNLLGSIFLNQLFAPLIIRNKSGRIINFSTIAVKLGIKGESIYAASKAGVESYSRTLARELSDFNITVNCIAPGPIDTDLTKGVTNNQINKIVEQQIIQRQMKPKDILEQVKLLLSNDARNITGQTIGVGGS